jgi:hypothetical protein
MGDGIIVAWDSKYYYRHWRAVAAIRNGDKDGNSLTEVDLDWSPHGVPQSNIDRPRAPWTAAFPSYPSGHSVLTGSLFRTLQNYFGTDEMPFDFIPDEWNGITRDAEYGVRPRIVRSFKSFSQAAEDSLLSRIYLGVHWRFDMFPGNEAGRKVADFVYENFIRPRNVTSSTEDTEATVVAEESEETEATEEVEVTEVVIETEDIEATEVIVVAEDEDTEASEGTRVNQSDTRR